MYQKILLCALVICCYTFPAGATEPDPDGVLTSQDLQTVATAAKAWTGTRYRYGGKDRNGIDCSHFVQAIYSQVFDGFDYRMTDDYLHDPDFAPTSAPLVGDIIVFLSPGGAATHVGIITDVAGKKFIGAQTSTGVKEASFAANDYWGKRPYKILSLLAADSVASTEHEQP